VTQPPVITSAASVSATVGQLLSYQTEATNSPTSYGFGWVSPSGGPASFSVSTGLFNHVPATAGTYSFVVTASNAYGTASKTVAMTVTSGGGATAPTIATQPAATSTSVGGSASFTVVANGTGPLSYQWRRNGSNLSDGAGISGATTATLTLSNVQSAAAGNYDVVVSNASGTISSTIAVLTVNAVVVTQPPVITSAASVSATVGQLLSYQTEATNSPSSYGFGWISPSGGPASFSVSTGLFNHVPATAGTYSFVVTASNAYGTASKTVTLTVVGAASSAPETPVPTDAASYFEWTLANFSPEEVLDPAISGPDVILAGDGLTNLVKYALCLNPREPATIGLPEVVRTASGWAYLYGIRRSAADVTVTIEMTFDGTAWSDDGVTIEKIDADEERDYYLARSRTRPTEPAQFRLIVHPL